MSNTKQSTQKDAVPNEQITRQVLPNTDLTKLLIQHFGHHEGLFDLLVEFQIGMGAFPTHDNKGVMPGAVLGVSGVGLQATQNKGPNTVDAAEANPLIEKTGKKSSKKA